MSNTNDFTPGTHFGDVASNTASGKEIVLSVPSKRPLSPSITVSKTNSGSDTIINLDTIIFISEHNMPKNGGKIDFQTAINFDIHYLVTETNKVNIYVANPGSFEAATTFYPFVVNILFKPADIPNLNNDFNTIKVINWDADPEGSRGTETTVKNTAN